MTRTLVVMRHAKSSWKTADPDLLRPLSGRGTRDAVVAGHRLAGTRFDVALVSPAERTRQTWQCLTMNGVGADDLRVEDALYHSGTSGVMGVLRGLPEEAHRVLLIGHEPTVSDLVLTLCAPSPHRTRIEGKFPTSGLAILSHSGDWAGLEPGGAQLVAFEVPRG